MKKVENVVSFEDFGSDNHHQKSNFDNVMDFSGGGG